MRLKRRAGMSAEVVGRRSHVRLIREHRSDIRCCVSAIARGDLGKPFDVTQEGSVWE